MPEWDIEGTKAAYEELCRSHDRIADFRAKLLALLPIASGTGIFLLLNLNGVEAEQYLLLNIGIFGCLITFGLFLYELRGIQRCKGLSHCGKELEKKLLGENSHVGTFSGEPNPAFGFVGNTWAALIIYPTIISGWFYLALVKSMNTWALLGASISLIVFILFGFLTIKRQNKILEQ